MWAQKIGKLLTISVRPFTHPFGLHVCVCDESVAIQGHHSLVCFKLTKELICGVFWAVLCLYFASQIRWKIFLL